MSRKAQRLVLVALVVVLILLTYLVWTRELYLLELRVKDARLQSELQQIERINRRLETRSHPKEISDPQEMRQEIEMSTSELRQLPFKKSVIYQKLDRSDLKQFILGKLGAQYSPEEFKNYELALKRMGLIPSTVELMPLISELLSEQVAAFYDPDTHELFTFKDLTLSNNIERTILSHELVHALQDQNFNFKALALRAKDNDDAALAASALLEGDATFQMGIYLRENFQAQQLVGDLQVLFAQQNAKLLSAPPFLRDSLTFPYQEGQLFISQVHAQGGNAAINACFTNPPVSTEQILHPEKYLGPKKDLPQKVEIKFKLGPGARLLHENVVGELGLRSLFGALLGPEKAAQAAQGWGGDRYALYDAGNGKWILVWKSVWDTPKDAREFFNGMEDLYNDRFGTLARNPILDRPSADADVVFYSATKQKQSLSIQGATVVFIDAPDTRTLQAILSQIAARK